MTDERLVNEKPMRVVVVGAGLSGLVCARRLAEHGHVVTVLDKGRAPGGRASTRENAQGQCFDHGAQFFTARSPWLLNEVERWREAGVVDVWTPRRAPGAAARRRNEPWWIGTPRMSSVAGYLATGLDVQCRETVSSLTHDGTQWTVVASSAHVADALVLAIPAPQSVALLDPRTPTGRFAASAAPEPCWAAMVLVVGSSPFDVLEPTEGPVAWAAREGSKKGRDATTNAWVVHASPAWSRQHLEDAPESIARVLAEELAAALGVSVLSSVAHRWRYARAAAVPPTGEWFDPHTTLVLCGDWVHGARIESALLSGRAAADRLLEDRRLAP